ncbi:LuxR family transcriptional regulator [Streptomyces sp. NBC_01317]|uniref:helix-turn-helix transcriptional regulator n=1 Tax=Streptomyces sp. NBC_01317 TaxID=2903822 RepID=UPI002E0FC6AC|nr:LuxR family transcriptional regulator [Streptomyces sp. NBC_01317]
MQQYRSPLVGRHDEVGDVARALRATGAAVRTLLVSGVAGAGKTALLHEARRAAAKKGAKVLRLGWEVAEEPAGAGALADAVCGVLAKIHDGRILARVTAVRRAQAQAQSPSQAESQSQSPSRSRAVGRGGEVALLSALGEVLADAARQVPFALVVDDADRMPDPTASALGLLLRAFRPAGVPVVLAARPMLPGQVGGGGQLLAAADRVVELPALSSAEVGELIVRRLDRPVEPGLVTAVLRALGPLAGSPGAVLSVLASLEECGALLELDGQMCLTVPEDELRLTPDAAELARLGWPHASPDAETFETATALARLAGQAELRLDDLRGVRPLKGVRGAGAPEVERAEAERHEAGLPEAGFPGAGLPEAGLPEIFGRVVDGLVRDRVVTVDRAGRITFAVPALAVALRALPGCRDVRPLHATITRVVTDRLGAVAAGAAHPRLADHVAAAGSALDAALALPLLLSAARTHAKSDPSWGARAYHSALRHLSPYDPRATGVLRESVALSLRNADHVGVLALGERVLACLEEWYGGDGRDGERGGEHGEHGEHGEPRVEDRDHLEWVTRACTLSTLHEHRSPQTDDVDPRYGVALAQVPAAAALAVLGGAYGIGPITPITPITPNMPITPTTHLNGGLPEPPEPLAQCASSPGPDPLPSLAEVRLLAAAVGPRAEFERTRRALARDAPDHALSAAPLDQLRNAAAYGDLAGALDAVLGERYVDAGQSTAVQYHAMVRDYLTGRWDSALSAARRVETRGRADGAPGVGQPARALAAEIQLVRGKLGRAREWLDLIPDSVSHPLVARARLGVRYWSGHGDRAMEAEAVAAAWRDVRRAREDGLLAGLDRVLLRILSIAVERNDPEAVRHTMAEIEKLYEEAASPLTHEVVLVGRGMAHGDAQSALSAYELVRERGDVPLLVDCCGCLAEVGDDPELWLAEATRSGHALGMGRPVRSRLGAAARRRNVSLPRRRAARGGRSERDERGERDVQLIDMVSDGSTNRQIAARLGCSEKTVEQRLTRLFKRTGCRSRAELAAAWLDGSLVRQGLVPDTGASERHGGDGPALPTG